MSVRERPLRVGLDLLYLLADSGGVGRYAIELIPELLRLEPGIELSAFVNRDAPPSLMRAPWAGSVRWVRTPVARARFEWRIPYQQTALPLRIARGAFDVIHGPGNAMSLMTPGARRVITLHDLIWVHHPETAPNPIRRAVTHSLAMAGAHRAARIVTDTLATRTDLVHTAGLDPARIDVAPLGVCCDVRTEPTSAGDLRERLRLGERRIVFCVAQLRSHKNLPRLIRAFAALGRDDACLAIAGTPTPHELELRRVAEALGVGDRVHTLGWVSDADLEALYRDAEMFVLPSLCEGFGLPMLEAMARSLPVACADIPALREVAGDAAIRFAPHDVRAMSAAIGRLLDNPALAADLVRRGSGRCEEFSWRRTARETLASYRRALEPARG